MEGISVSRHYFRFPCIVANIVNKLSKSKALAFKNGYKYFILISTFLVYVTYHMSRKPLSIIKNQLNPCNSSDPKNCTGWAPFDGHNSQTLLGSLDFAYLFAYAIGMFINGHLAERTNLRYFLFIGMSGSAFLTAMFGLGRYWNIHYLWYFIIVQILCGIFQSTGWPPVVTCIANWFGKGRRGFIMGVWNSHTSIGNILGALIAGAFVNYDWGLSFIIPAIIMFVVALFVLFTLVPHPDDMQHQLDYKHTLNPEIDVDSREHLLSSRADELPPYNSSLTIDHNLNIHTSTFVIDPNMESSDNNNLSNELVDFNSSDGQPIGFISALLIPGVFEFSICLFFAKLVSYTFLFWLPFYISRSSHFDSSTAADLSTLFDVGGILGGIVAGATSDYHGGRALTCMIMLLFAAPAMYMYEMLGSYSMGVNILLLMICGFLVNGPYSLITTAVSADLGTHSSLKGNAKALSTVTAIIDGTGSIGAALGPLITSLIASAGTDGWNYVFYMLIISDILALLCLVRLSWREVKSMQRNGLFMCICTNQNYSRIASEENHQIDE